MSKLQIEELSDEAISVNKVTWKIADFISLIQESDFIVDCTSFSAAGATWCLQMYPNKKKHAIKKSVGCIDLRIVRLDSLFSQHSISFSFHIKDCNDDKKQCYAGKVDITFNGDSMELKSSFSNCSEDSYLQLDGSLVLLGMLHIKRDQLTKSVYKPNNFEITGPKKLAHDIKKLLLNDTDSDVTIRVKGKTFPAHKAIIGVRSPVFAAMLRSEMKEKATGIVYIDDLDPDIFPFFLSYLYTEDLNELSERNVFGVYMAADKYDVVELKSSCVQFMKSCLSVTNFCDVVTISLRHDERELLKEAIDFFSSHLKEIIRTVQWQTFLTENTIQGNELLNKALSSWQKI